MSWVSRVHKGLHLKYAARALVFLNEYFIGGCACRLPESLPSRDAVIRMFARRWKHGRQMYIKTWCCQAMKMSVYDAKNPELSKVPSHVYNILDLIIIYSLASFSHLQKAIATTGHKLCSRKSTSFCEFVLQSPDTSVQRALWETRHPEHGGSGHDDC